MEYIDHSVDKSDDNRKLFQELFYELSVTSKFDGLALDVERRKLYYTDAGYGRVGELSMDGSEHRIIIADSSSKPRGIVLDQQNKWVHQVFLLINRNACCSIVALQMMQYILLQQQSPDLSWNFSVVMHSTVQSICLIPPIVWASWLLLESKLRVPRFRD